MGGASKGTGVRWIRLKNSPWRQKDISVTQGSFQRGCPAETFKACVGEFSCDWEVVVVGV